MMMILSGSYNHPNHPKRTHFLHKKYLLGKRSQAWNTVPTQNLPTGLAAAGPGHSEDGFFCGYSAVDFLGEGGVLATWGTIV